MNKYTKDELAVIVLDSYDGLEYKHKKAILGRYEKAGDIFDNPQKVISYLLQNVDERSANTLKNSLNYEYADFILQKLEKRSVTAVTYLSEYYPKNLFDYPLNALVLYAKGNLELLKSNKKFAIVGSRKTLPFVLRTTEDISNALSNSGAVIVTGSAVGGDRSALLGAVDSGNVISVLAHGSDYVYPQSNRTLVDKVASLGLVISEYPPETTSAPWRFPMRNRIISALANGVLITSGSEDSGTKYTAKFAEAYSKRVYAFPYSLGEKSGEICNLLIKLGKASLVTYAEDIADGEGLELVSNDLEAQFEPEEVQVLKVLDGSLHIDEICERTGKKVFELMPVLSMLEIKGAVCREGGNRYSVLIKFKQ